MKVSRERLSVIGRMIGIYREERRGNTQNSWTQLKFCEDICSPNTLKNIESGGIARSQELYEKLLEKLDLKLGEFPVIDEAANQLIDDLYIAIEYFDNNEIDVLTSKGIKVLEKAKDYVYYAEMYNFFIDLRKYYLEDIVIDNTKVDRYIKLIALFSYQISDLLKLLIFAKVKLYSMTDFQIYKGYIESLDLNSSEYLCLRFIMMHYFYLTNQPIEMNKILDEIEVKCESNNNYVRLLDVYSNKIMLYSEVDKEKAEIYIEKVENLLEFAAIGNYKAYEVVSIIADYYYNCGSYYKALDYYKKISFNDNLSLVPKLLHLADCQNHLGIKVNLPILQKKELRNLPDDIKILYNYFLIDDVPLFIKQNYIMKKVLPLLEDNWFIRIFRYELAKLVKETNHYKLLFDFDKYIEKNN